MNETKVYSSTEFSDLYIKDTIKKVALILEEKGYDPIRQLVGYLESKDPGYITSYKEARRMIEEIDDDRLLEVLVREFIK